MKNFLLSAGVIGLMAGALIPAIGVNTVHAVDRFEAGDACTARFLTFPAWYRGLTRKGCDIVYPSGNAKNGETSANKLNAFIFTIILNLIEIALQLVAYAAVGFVIYGGFKYLTAAGDSSRVTAGRKIITNALIGLVISFMSIAIVNLVAGNIG